MQETSVASNVTPCGTYAKGETQDYRVLIIPPLNDVGITELVSPNSADCGTGSQYVTVRIQNFGSVDQSNIPVTAIVKQGSTTVATITGTFPGTIPGNANVVYTLQTPFTSTANTSYTITSSTSLIGDQLSSNDQNITNVTVQANTSDPTGTAVICGTNALLKATSVSSDAYTWYNSSSSSTPIAAGDNITSQTILSTYYLQKNDNNLKTGPANKDEFPSGSYNEYNGNFMLFSNSVPVVIKSARLYIGNSNAARKLNFVLGRSYTINSNGSFSYLPEAIVTLDIFATDPTPQAGAQPYDAADQGSVFYFNLPVDVPGDHILFISNPDNNDLASVFRNNNIPSNPYPIGIPGIFTFTGNSAPYASGGQPNDYQKFYYFFYDIKLRLAGCPSPRVPIVASTATAPTISILGNVLTSSITTGNHWFRDGAPVVPGAYEQTYTATTAGTYTTEVTDANGCTLASNPINFTPTAVPNINPAEIGLTVSPNPAKGQFDLKLETRTKADLDISLINTSGQRVYHSGIPNFIGQLNTTISTGKFSSGIYYLQILHDNKMYIKKVVVIQ